MKKVKIIILSIICLFSLTGCIKKDSMDNINIYATSYPIYYLIDSIYGYNSTINSIYPKGTDIETHTLTNKQIKEYSKTDLFVYNGQSNEKNLAATFTNNNKNIRLIDAAKGIQVNYDQAELWLSPSNYLMLAQNIKDSLLNYVSSTIVKQEIEKNYDDLKFTISEFDADLKTIADNAENKTIIVGNPVFLFLKKYGFEVLCIKNDENLNTKEYNKAKRYIENKSNSYVFILNTDTDDDNVITFKNKGAKVLEVNSMKNLTDEQVEENIDYVTMMNNFLEVLKSEVYN